MHIATPPTADRSTGASVITPRKKPLARQTLTSYRREADVESGSAGSTTVLSGYRASDDAVRGATLTHLMAGYRGTTFIETADLSADRRIFCFGWRGAFSVPMFQFAAADFSLKAKAHWLVDVLSPVMDNSALPTWFTKSDTRPDSLARVNVNDHTALSVVAPP